MSMLMLPFYRDAVLAKIRELKGSRAGTKFVVEVNSHKGDKSGSQCTCVMLQLGTNHVIRANRADGKSR